MRKASLIAGAAMVAATTFATPVGAQQTGQPGSGQTPSGGGTGGGQTGGGQQGGTQQGGQQPGMQPAGGQVTASGAGGGPMTANGSCGMDRGSYGTYGVMPDGGYAFVDSVFYRIDYSGVPAPTTVGVIIRYNDELEDQRGVATFTAANSSGTYEGAVGSGAANPNGQGGTQTDPIRASAGISNSRGNRDSDGIPQSTAQRRSGGGTSNTSTGGGGVQAGEYVFYVYTGEIRDMPETVKDGPSGPRFFADEKGYLGKFSCSVSDN